MYKPAALVTLALCSCLFSQSQEPAPVRPKSGKVQIFKESDLKPGMKGYAWTVLSGTEPEPIPVEIVGILKNQWGPKQDIIIGKMGGKAIRTNVAGGMSGSPVYIDGKLVGAVALRLSVFSPDAICGITPIELMTEVNDFDQSRPADARVPGSSQSERASVMLPPGMLSQVVSAGDSGSISTVQTMVPIETPLTFAGFNDNVLREFGPFFQQMGMTVAAAPGWEHSLQPGDAVTAVLVTGDMSVSGNVPRVGGLRPRARNEVVDIIVQIGAEIELGQNAICIYADGVYGSGVKAWRGLRFERVSIHPVGNLGPCSARVGTRLDRGSL